MIQHFLEERFHKAVRFFSGIKAKDLEVIGTLKVTGNLTVNDLDPARPYKVYTAKVTLVDSTISDVLVFENTLGNVTWAGIAIATLTGGFTVGKTVVFITPLTFVTQGLVDLTSVDSLGVTLYDNTGFGTNDYSFMIEIRVYP